MGKFASLGLNVATGVKMPIIHPKTGEPITDKEGAEAYLELLSADSEKGMQHDRKITRRAFEKMRRPARNKNDEAVSDLIEAQTEKIVALLTGWYLVGLDGVPLQIQFTEENAREFLSDSEVAWIRRQALLFVEDAANFTKASLAN